MDIVLLKQRVSIIPVGGQSIAISISVYLSVCLSVWRLTCLRNHTSPNFRSMLYVAMVQASFDGCAVPCVYFRVCGWHYFFTLWSVGQNHRQHVCFIEFATGISRQMLDKLFDRVCQAVGTGIEVCRLQLHLAWYWDLSQCSRTCQLGCVAQR